MDLIFGKDNASKMTELNLNDTIELIDYATYDKKNDVGSNDFLQNGMVTSKISEQSSYDTSHQSKVHFERGTFCRKNYETENETYHGFDSLKNSIDLHYNTKGSSNSIDIKSAYVPHTHTPMHQNGLSCRNP